MKNARRILGLLLSLMLVLGTTAALADEGSVKIGILQYVEHAALDSATEGFKQALKENGYEDVTIDYKNASGDNATLQLMAEQFASGDYDVLLGVATPAVQALLTAVSDKPILGTAVTDYVSAGLVASNEAPGANLTGTSDMNPVDKQIDLLMQLVPDAKTIGVLYTSSEVNSEIQAKMAEQEAARYSLGVVTKTISAVGEVQQAVESLVGQVDALYIPTDNICASAMAVIASVANPAKLPVIVGEENMCNEGGLATIGLNYTKLGYQTGMMAVRILEDGANPAEMPIEGLGDADVYLNQVTADEVGIVFPQELVDAAVNIVKAE